MKRLRQLGRLLRITQVFVRHDLDEFVIGTFSCGGCDERKKKGGQAAHHQTNDQTKNCGYIGPRRTCEPSHRALPGQRHAATPE